MRPLGDTQRSCLRSLAERNGGVWSAGAGWLWDTYSGTVRIMESLVKRGLVVDLPSEGFYRQRRFKITDAGRNVVQRNLEK